ncbi:class I SAM-dependent methyltransferase [Streptomyces pluripotens]|uniref:Class I SAM-dependent methyltransferase n=1 Tax=Streptomyces pluripotens TaxID=1355015 RepID=A0A221NW34_9ACTN|nr:MULTISPECIES: class I SAM-dependent methyltransferase [Streptomyces]ARP69866.1 methyltransferase type 12 [Streptomyces pluripotens]ASN24124.1 class I SAM-dependent methyltransferase [Streptomyces pluripotens]KIE24010.1 methyltransferase type 12 [Streptomyces sp. MUSC 125]MCH0555623.1 class I SAM-dependent methyltransferase [Streptomyces sp. MUM 16J]
MPTSPPTPYIAPAATPSATAAATGAFREPRREECPWCGSRNLRTRLRVPDPLRQRPGPFVVDQCGDCAHAFQNPRLTPEGLASFHRGLHERQREQFVARPLSTRAVRRRHRATASWLSVPSRFPEPESWLDVGTGHAQFPEVAQEFFPYTSFDGLDPTARAERARRAGLLEESHRGYLSTPGMAARLRARYDVVSMFHHLQHAPDPRAELRGALTALRPGGHLVVEVPDPSCAFATLLGKWWLPHSQPRHLHLMPLDNLRTELEVQGCAILATDRRSPHIPDDLSAALSLALARVHPFLRTVAVPLPAVASAADRALAPLLRRTPFSNAYRIVARKDRT